MTLRILDLAEADPLSGFGFYERQSSGVGWYFLETLHSEIESLRLYAGTHRKLPGYYRALSRRFPFAIYYRIDGEAIQIWRILDCRRDPTWIRKQLKR